MAATTSNAPSVKRAAPPPPFPLLHSHVTTDEFTTPFPTGPWSVNINAPFKGVGDSNYTTLATYTRGGMLMVWLKACYDAFPIKGVYGGIEATMEKDKKTVNVSPNVYYKFQKDGDNILALALRTGRLSHTWMHNQGTFTSDMNVNLYDYCSMDGCVNARLYPGLLGGFDFVFDPTRSGLKNWRVGLKYRMAHAVSYDAAGAIAVSSVHAFIPGKLQGAVHVKKTRKGCEGTVGLATWSPCGSKIAAKLQIHDGVAAFGFTRIINGDWRVGAGVHGNVYKKTYGGVGVSLSYEQ